ncbi:endonuclease domain-containing protein [Auraticoccus cholistanensis]|uniref:endonuclease domain-containing protein n=1 Tax=Auraticoccus cholistanensis TaxID=2656650 RepID=UPI0018D1FF5D
MNPDLVQALREGDGLVRAREHPALRSTLHRERAAGRLTRLLPGVYCPTGRRAEPLLRLRAVGLWDRDAVLVGGAAARLTFWPDRRTDEVELASPRGLSAPAGYRVSRRRVPLELVVERGGLRHACAALAALDLAASSGPEVIDRCLRARAASLAELHRALALTSQRPGNRRRRELLHDSRDEPWSAAERLLHQLLREAGVVGWRANAAVVAGGRRFVVDVLFADARVVLEVDGREFHSSAEAFESDRRRQNLLVLDGWTVLRFTWRMLTVEPDAVLEAVVRATAAGPGHPRRRG